MESKQLCCAVFVTVVLILNQSVWSIPVSEVLKTNGSTSVVPLGEIDVDNLNATTNGTRKDL